MASCGRAWFSGTGTTKKSSLWPLILIIGCHLIPSAGKKASSMTDSSSSSSSTEPPKSLPLASSSTATLDEVNVPPYVIMGQTVHLYCKFHLRNGTDLYSLKWFKDGKEFYRSVPKALVRQNRRLVFPLPGVLVDFENSKLISSGNHQLALMQVSLSTSGQYTCQITLDAPPFEFMEQTGHMTVISMPERFPVISGHKGQDYRLGDWVHLNCTCYDTYPPARLKWYLNGHEADESYVIRYVPSPSKDTEGLQSATLGLSFELTHFHFAPTVDPAKRELWARCEATMPPIKGMTYPYNREVFLGSIIHSYDHYHASSFGGQEAATNGCFKIHLIMAVTLSIVVVKTLLIRL